MPTVRTTWGGLRLSATLAVIACGLVASTVGATSSPRSIALPTPGTASQVAALVNSSSSIVTLPATTVPPLSQATQDTPDTFYHSTANFCTSLKECDFGDLTSKTSVIVFGDSHAQMWLPALVPIATALKFKLILLWHSSCPAANVITPAAICTSFRTASIAEIRHQHPTLVLLANKTTNVVSPNGKRITDAAWEQGIESTITALSMPKTTVVVVGDVTQFDAQVPACLASYPSKVQTCSVPLPNPAYSQHLAVEKAAAVAMKVPYVNTEQWLCTARCSPLVGNMIVYSDQGHVSSTYAEYLTTVWKTEMSSLLAPPSA